MTFPVLVVDRDPPLQETGKSRRVERLLQFDVE